MRIFMGFLAILANGIVFAAPTALPLAKSGPCAAGYASSGGYCKPTKSARYAVQKIGGCPAGYSASGNYCLAGKSARAAVLKNGACPSGWATSGNYCLGK